MKVLSRILVVDAITSEDFVVSTVTVGSKSEDVLANVDDIVSIEGLLAFRVDNL